MQRNCCSSEFRLTSRASLRLQFTQIKETAKDQRLSHTQPHTTRKVCAGLKLASPDPDCSYVKALHLVRAEQEQWEIQASQQTQASPTLSAISEHTHVNDHQSTAPAIEYTHSMTLPEETPLLQAMGISTWSPDAPLFCEHAS